MLGPRLRECTQLVADLTGLTAFDIFGGIDALKLHSSMTLFAHAAPDDPLFKTVLDRYFDAQADPEHRIRVGPLGRFRYWNQSSGVPSNSVSGSCGWRRRRSGRRPRRPEPESTALCSAVECSW